MSALAKTLVVAGAIELIAAVIARGGAEFRDHGAAIALDRSLWLVGGVALGWTSASLAVAVRAGNRTQGAGRVRGMSVGIALHCAAIAILALQLAASVVR